MAAVVAVGCATGTEVELGRSSDGGAPWGASTAGTDVGWMLAVVSPVVGADVDDDPQAITMAKATRSGVIVNALDLAIVIACR